MTQEDWTAVDHYFDGLLAPHDGALESALHDSARAGLPKIHVTANQGKLLQMLALSVGARQILEIGTLGGYSTIWLARALAPGGRLVSLELEPKHAEVARTNVTRAGLSDKVEIRLGVALELLPQLASENAGPFDLVFIDADKVNIPHYLEWAIRLSRRGSLIITDNVVRDGRVLEASNTDPGVQGVRKFFEMLKTDPRVTATAIQTVGTKGWDGIAIALVVADIS